eukprot:Em0016g752a
MASNEDADDSMVITIAAGSIEGATCSLVIPNALLLEWRKSESVCYISSVNEHIVEGAIVLNPESVRLESKISKIAFDVANRFRKSEGRKKEQAGCMEDYVAVTDELIENLVRDVEEMERELSWLHALQNSGKPVDEVSARHKKRKLAVVRINAVEALSFAESRLPRAHKVKAVRIELNETVELIRIPGYDGCYRHVENAVCEEISRLLVEFPTALKQGDRIKIKFSGDGAKFSRTTNILILSFSILHLQTRYLSGADTLLDHGFIEVGENRYLIEIFFGGDMKFLLFVLGLNEANSVYACPFCNVHKDNRWDMSKPEELYNTAPAARTIASLRHSYAVGKSVNTREGSIQLPLTKIPVDHFVIDELHVLCRIFDVMVDNLIALAVLMDKQARDGSQHHINGLAVAIRECGVTFHIWKDLEKDGKYKCTSLTGGGRKKVIKMLPSKLEVVLPHTTTEATVMLWKDFQQLYLVISSQEPGLPSVIHDQAKRWINSFLSIPAEGYQKARVTPYMHCLAYHIPDQIRRYGNLRMFSGQGVEKHSDDAKRAYLSSNNPDASLIAQHPTQAQDASLIAQHPTQAQDASLIAQHPTQAQDASLIAQHPTQAQDASLIAQHPTQAQDQVIALLLLASTTVTMSPKSNQSPLPT